MSLNEQQFSILFNILDEDQNDSISLEELATFFLNISIDPGTGRPLSADQRTHLLESEGQWDQFRIYFNRYDQNGDGLLSIEELRLLINDCNPNVIASIIELLSFRLPEVNIRHEQPGRRGSSGSSGASTLTMTTNLSLPGEPEVTLTKLQRDLKEYVGRELVPIVGMDMTTRLSEPRPNCVAIHQAAERMVYSEEGLRDLGHIAGRIGNTSLGNILTTFQHHLERGWNYNQQHMPERARYNSAGLTMLLTHLLTDPEEGLQRELPAYTIPHYEHRGNMRISQFLFGINKYLDKLLQYGERGEYMHSCYVVSYTELGVDGYEHKSIISYINANGTNSDPRQFVTGCSGGNCDRVVLALSKSIEFSWSECERKFPLVNPGPGPGVSPRSRTVQEQREQYIREHSDENQDDPELLYATAMSLYPSPPPSPPRVQPGSLERRRERDELMAQFIGQGLDPDDAYTMAYHEYPSPPPSPPRVQPGPAPAPGPPRVQPGPVVPPPVGPLSVEQQIPQGFPRPNVQPPLDEQRYNNSVAELNRLLGYYRSSQDRNKNLRGFLSYLINYSRNLPLQELDSPEEWLNRMAKALFQHSDALDGNLIDLVNETDWSAPFSVEGGRKRRRTLKRKVKKTKKVMKLKKILKSKRARKSRKM